MTSYDHMTLLHLRLGRWADTTPPCTAATAARTEAMDRPATPQVPRQVKAMRPAKVRIFSGRIRKAVP